MAALKGWKEKDSYIEFPLVKLGENAVYFSDLTIAPTDSNVLQPAVKIAEQGVNEFWFIKW